MKTKLSPAQQDRTFIPIRRKTKKIFDAKAKKSKLTKIDFMDFIVNKA